jgi:two-component system, response regulator YesN
VAGVWMYRLVIVDDEAIVRRGLKEKVEWDELNCEICAVGSNGIEGKEIIDRLQPDIVISDIKMPGMNGLELAEYINKKYPKIITILLSGFSEFNYAQEAVRHRVFDYLLKPIELDDLKSCIRKATDQLDTISSAHLEMKRNKDKKEDKVGLVESSIFLNVLVNGNKDIENSKRKLLDLGINLSSGLTVAFEFYDSKVNSDSHLPPFYQFAVNNILKETYRNYQIDTTIVNFETKFVVIVKFDSNIELSQAQKQVIEVSDICEENIRKYLKKRVNVGIGKPFRGIESLHDSYITASRVLENNLFWGINRVENHSIKDKTSLSRGVILFNPELFEAVYVGDSIKSKNLLSELISTIKVYKDKSLALNTCLDFLLEILRNVPDRKMKEQVTQTITTFPGLRTFNEYIHTMFETVEMICDDVIRKRDESRNGLLDQVKGYLNTHYYDPGITLQHVSELFKISNSHLSRLFKKETGINFSEYLSIKRVKKAKEFLEIDMQLSVIEVAAKVGFYDGKYFGQVFKKYYGVTPSHFRERIRNQGKTDKVI